MKSVVTFKAKSNNHYFYSLNKQQVFLCNPVLAYMLELINKNVNITNWIINDSKSDANLLKIGNYKKSQLNYYHLKLKFLMEHDYLKQPNPRSILNTQLLPERIMSNIINLKQVIFEVTEKCNLRCSYCTYSKYYNNEDKRSNRDFKLKNAYIFLNYLENIRKTSNVNFKDKLTISFYGGEPLLNIQFIKNIVQHTTTNLRLKDIVVFSMTTNGLLLDKYIDYLVKYNFSIAISLDGNRNSNQYRILPGGEKSFDKVMHNIEYIQKEYPVFFDENINFISVIHNRNSTYKVNRYIFDMFNKHPMATQR